MPNRILREGILDSEAVNKLTAAEEVFYRRLMSVVDDFGRFDARPQVLRSRLYPLKTDEVREADISRWIAAAVKAGLIALYTHDSRQYLLFGKLGEPRAKESKYPHPPPDLDRSTLASASTCAQTRSYVPYSGSLSGSRSPPTPQGGEGGSAAPRPDEEKQRIESALGECAGRDVDREIRSAAKELLSRDPPYSTQEIFVFRSRFLEICPWAVKQKRTMPTIKEILKYIGRVRKTTPPDQFADRQKKETAALLSEAKNGVPRHE